MEIRSLFQVSGVSNWFTLFRI